MNDGSCPEAWAVFNSRRHDRKPQRRLGFSSFVQVAVREFPELGAPFVGESNAFARVLALELRDEAEVSSYSIGVMSSAAVRQAIALAAELSDEERRVVVDAIAPQESVAGLAAEWEAEIVRRAERVRTGQSVGKPANEVFDRLEARLKAR
jgi:hypothetical protein